MGRRLQLDQILRTLLGSSNVYFQPPSNTIMKYPCILYSRDRVAVKRADNRLYGSVDGYKVTVIDSNPDSEIPNRIATLQMSIFDRSYTSDSLHHFIYNVYY